jgi:hypothetical protein
MIRKALPSQAALADDEPPGSPKPRLTMLTAKAVPVWKALLFQKVDSSGGGPAGGNKVLLTMFARQLFPSGGAKESFH